MSTPHYDEYAKDEVPINNILYYDTYLIFKLYNCIYINLGK